MTKANQFQQPYAITGDLISLINKALPIYNCKLVTSLQRLKLVRLTIDV